VSRAVGGYAVAAGDGLIGLTVHHRCSKLRQMFELVETTIAGIHAAFLSGELTAEELVYRYMERIALHDTQLNSVLELNPDAPAIAAALDAIAKAGGSLGPLHGVPILIKDNINTGDRMHTSAGSLVLANNRAPCDAFVAGRLRAAGAVILGKTNMTEMANFMAEGMRGGFSSRGGQVLNPYDPSLAAGGSSTGSGVAVSANLCAAAIGTETSGSILSPAINNMVVGVKPTVGLVSRTGIVPIAFSQDTAGPLGRTVADAARVLTAVAGFDPTDPATGAARRLSGAHYHDALRRDALHRVRVGVPRSVYWDELADEEAELAEEALGVLRDLGAHVVDPADVPTAAEIKNSDVLFFEFKTALNAYLAELGGASRVRSLRELINAYKAMPGASRPFGLRRLLRSQLIGSGTLTEPDYIRARIRDVRLCRTEGLDRAFSENGAQALLFPGIRGYDHAARAGYPTVVVPMGFLPDGSPSGVSFCGPAFSESRLLSFAYALEQTTRRRVAPTLS
jgi:amidase